MSADPSPAAPAGAPLEAVIWHDLECGCYEADLPLWRELARDSGGVVLDIGAGTGRVAIDLLHEGHAVVALDHDPVLLDELRRRADGLTVGTEVADARSFALGERFGAILVPMQTIQLLGGAAGRLALLRSARAHLRPGGLLAMAIAEDFEAFGPDGAHVMPDVAELGGTVYSSRPIAVAVTPGAVVLERLREVVGPGGGRSEELDRVVLERVGAAELERQGASAGFQPLPARAIEPTTEHVGSTVVMLRV